MIAQPQPQPQPQPATHLACMDVYCLQSPLPDGIGIALFMSTTPVCDLPLVVSSLGSLLCISPLYVYLELFQPASTSHFASVRGAVLAALVRYIILSGTSMMGLLLVRAVVLVARPKHLTYSGSGGKGGDTRCVVCGMYCSGAQGVVH